MPELPDVELFRRHIEETSLHRNIERLDIHAPGLLENFSPDEMQDKVTGHKFNTTSRHGKYLFASLSDDGWVVFHFGMSGYPEYIEDGGNEPRHTRVSVEFSGGSRLAYVSQRKLGRISFTGNPDDYIMEHGLGPDALETSRDAAAFMRALGGAGGGLKAVLMDQSRIAGIGNEYSDEILFQARLSPRLTVKDISEEELHRLADTVKQVLETAIEAGAKPEAMPDTYLLPHRHKGETCPVCGGKIKQEKIGGRTAYYCPKCQNS